jgi:eukaryotic-like serine/threonine-protein kinase
MPSKPLEPGDPLRLGRFELLGRLGEGGQGVVYLGRGPNPGEEQVAVKVLRSTVDANVLERLGRELDAIHQVQPFVTAGVIEASAEGDRRYVVSEFIDGPSLQERVDTLGPLVEGDLQRLAVGTATALTAIHGAGVVHRDFKPANVLLGPDGPRVVDFGIARLTDAATITSGLIGTPSYVAPEQLAGARPTSAVDIFAWALTMIYAATGRLAFGADSVPAVMHRIMYEEPDVSGLTRGSPSASQAGPGGNAPAGQTSNPAGATTQATQTTQAAQPGGPTIPAAFAGTWKGTATMSAIGISGPRLTNDIEFRFVAGARTVPEKDQECANTLTLTTVTDTVLTFSEPQTPACVAGTVTFTRHGANLAYRWTDNIEQNVATLRKS